MQASFNIARARRENGHPSPLAYKLLPPAVLLAALAVDRTGWLSFSLVPMMCVLALVVFSFFLTSRQVIGWTVIYILAIAATLWMRRGVWSGSSGNVDALVATRALVASAAGVLACLFAKSREHDLLGVRGIILILDQLEIPAIISDRDGWLVHVNPKAEELLGEKVSFGSPFFEHFSVVEAKGKSIRSYVELATGGTSGPVSIQLAMGPDRAQVHSAVMLRVDIGKHRQVLTLIYPREAAAPSMQSLPQ
jgi:PAS domain-containing protein